MTNEVRIGIVGLKRGGDFAENATLAGIKIVAVCDNNEKTLNAFVAGDDVTRYSDYDTFLTHDMDGVILCNNFHEHVPFALKAFKAGKHVMSETTANYTIAEGVQLCEAVEESGLIYMLAENYPYTKFNQEMHRLYQTGELGKVTYAEGEYNHPMYSPDHPEVIPFDGHWRTFMPRSYYNTHALAPLMYITGLMPKTVVALPIESSNQGFAALVQMDEGAVFRLMGLGLPGHSNFYRVHGTKGAMEITRGPGYFGPEQVRVWHDYWMVPENTPEERTYVPSWPYNGELADKAGHGGGDFWVNYHFAQAIKTGTQPFLDVYRGVAMSTVGILIHRSEMAGGMPQEVPDFRDKVAREKYRNDTWRPDGANRYVAEYN